MHEAVSAHQLTGMKKEDKQEKKQGTDKKKVEWTATSQWQFCQTIALHETHFCGPQTGHKGRIDCKWDMLIDVGLSFTSTMNEEPVDNAMCNPEGLNVNTNAR